MQKTAEITSFQFYTILFLSRVFSLVTYVSGIQATLSTTDEVISAVIMGAFLISTSIPVMLLVRKDSSSSILTRASCISPVFEKIIIIIYLVSIIYTGIITAARFELLIGSVLFPETNVLFFVAMMLLAAAYTACRGIESIGRASVLYLIPVLLAFAFVFITLTDEFDTLNFTPVYTSEFPDIINSAYCLCARTGELGAIVLLIPNVKNHRKKHMYNWIVAVTGITVITVLMVGGVLGGFGKNQLFNMYSLSVLAEYGFVERLDAIISCIWLICAGVKMSMLFYLCNMLLTLLLKKSKKTIYISASAVLVFVFTAVISLSIVNFTRAASAVGLIILFTAAIVAVPISVLIGEKIKEKKFETK